jgi:glycerol-3-phosphate acyltransferase PlsY
MPYLIWAAGAAAAYLAGAIPVGYLFVKLRTGEDIRTLGSGNIGATNVARTQGRFWFVPVFAIDFLKGFAPVFWLAPWVAGRWPAEGSPAGGTVLEVVYGMAAMAGHLWPIYIGFRGGKGVATTGGVLFGLNWAAALIGTLVWFAVFLPSRYVSLASIAGALSMPPAQHFTEGRLVPARAGGWIVTAFLSLAAALVIWRHRENIGRLRRGEEKRMGGERT